MNHIVTKLSSILYTGVITQTSFCSHYVCADSLFAKVAGSDRLSIDRHVTILIPGLECQPSVGCVTVDSRFDRHSTGTRSLLNSYSTDMPVNVSAPDPRDLIACYLGLLALTLQPRAVLVWNRTAKFPENVSELNLG